MKTPYWEMRDLVTIGIFAAVTKVSSLLVALVGGGMNPLTLVLKNLLFTTLAIVLLYKVGKFGTLTLFTLVGALVSMLLMGGSMIFLPALLLGCLAAEGLILALGGYGKSINLMIGVGVYDFLTKAVSMGSSWVLMREQPQMLLMGLIIVSIGYLGALMGLVTGHLFVKELRHACIIRH